MITYKLNLRPALLQIVLNVINQVLLPNIMDVVTNGPETIITMASPQGGQAHFMVVEADANTTTTAGGASQNNEPWLAVGRSRLERGGIELQPANAENGTRAVTVSMTYYKNA